MMLRFWVTTICFFLLWGCLLCVLGGYSRSGERASVVSVQVYTGSKKPAESTANTTSVWGDAHYYKTEGEKKRKGKKKDTRQSK